MKAERGRRDNESTIDWLDSRKAQNPSHHHPSPHPLASCISSQQPSSSTPTTPSLRCSHAGDGAEVIPPSSLVLSGPPLFLSVVTREDAGQGPRSGEDVRFSSHDSAQEEAVLLFIVLCLFSAGALQVFQLRTHSHALLPSSPSFDSSSGPSSPSEGSVQCCSGEKEGGGRGCDHRR